MKEKLKEIIKDFHKGDLPKTKKRNLEIPLKSQKIITVSGVRRSGKTFILFETMKRLLKAKTPKENILYINFEDERLDFKKETLDLILQAYRELYPDKELSGCYFFFDEIQNVDGWEKFARRLYDTVTKNIFITGSNSKLLSKEIATSIRGRTITYEVYPLSFAEFLNFNGMEADLYHSKNRAKIANLFEQFLFQGGFIEIVNIKDKTLQVKILQDYFDTMLYRDLIERFNITNIPALKYFIKRVFENITNPLSVHKIFNELKTQGYKIGKNLLYEFMEASSAIYLFILEKKYAQSVLKEELGGKKAYVIDNGLLNAVTFKFSADYGKLLENLMFLEFQKMRYKTFFYKGKKECDFVLYDEKGDRTAIQVCADLSDADTRNREMEGLAEACKNLKINTGYILTLSQEETIAYEGLAVKIEPAFKFLLQNLQYSPSKWQ